MVTVEEVSKRIREQARGKLPADVTIDEDTVLEDLGLSSLQISEVVYGLEDDYGVEFDESRAADMKTLGELVALANESIGEAPADSPAASG